MAASSCFPSLKDPSGYTTLNFPAWRPKDTGFSRSGAESSVSCPSLNYPKLPQGNGERGNPWMKPSSQEMSSLMALLKH